MPIRTQSADGKFHEFPDDTAPEVVDRVMKQYAGENSGVVDPEKAARENRAATAAGFFDPLEGGAQLVSHLVPKRVERAVNEFNNWLSEKTGLVGKLPEGGMDEHARLREEALQKEGADKGINRMMGDILNPINYVGPAMISGAGKVAGLARAAAGGATAAALTPTTSDDFASEKALQVGVGGGVGGLFGLAGAGLSKGVEKIGEYVARNYPENIENTAVGAILRRMKQDEKYGGPTATGAIQLINAVRKPTVWQRRHDYPMTLADVGGQNVRGLAGSVARQPGEAKQIATQVLTQRDEKAAQRLSEDIARYVSSGQTMHQATEALLGARSAAARPAYDAAHALDFVWSPRLAEFFGDPAIKVGLNRGYELERLHALAEGRSITTTQLGVDLDTEGNIKLVKGPNMRLLDMAKQGLDAMIADERNDITGRLSARGVALDRLRRAYVDEIDSLDTAGVYAKARKAWAGYSASLDSVKLGRSVFGQSPEENAAAVSRLSGPNLEFYRIGVADMLRERLAKTGLSGDEAKALIKNPWMRDQLRPAFKSLDDYNSFIDAVTAENSMFEMKRAVLGGSQTAERLAEDTDAAGTAAARGASMLHRLAKGNLFSAAKDAWHMYQDLGFKPNPELSAKISEILFTAPVPKDIARKMTGKTPMTMVNPAAPAAQAISAGSGIAGTAAGVAGAETLQE